MTQLYLFKYLLKLIMGLPVKTRSRKRSPRIGGFTMPSNIAYIVIFGLGAASGYIYYDQNKEPQIIQIAQGVSLQPCFTDHFKCLPLITKQINSARQSVRMMAYSFTSNTIAEALINAKRRGIDVQLILDKSQSDQHSQRKYLESSGIPIYIDAEVAIAHNKIIIIDQDTVLTGSYNFSNAAENRNAENIIIIKNAMLAKTYLNNWQYRRQKSTPLKTYRVTHKNSSTADNPFRFGLKF